MNREQSQEEFEGQLKEKQLQEGQITEDTEKSKQENKITEGVIWKQLLLFFFPILFGIIFACMLVYFVRPSQIEGESKVI